jgi:hypothetical protein
MGLPILVAEVVGAATLEVVVVLEAVLEEVLEVLL